jgi:hypothetical protein
LEGFVFFFFQSTYCELVGMETKYPIFVQSLTDFFVLCITASSFSISCLAFEKSQQQHFCSEEEAPFFFSFRNALDRSKDVHKDHAIICFCILDFLYARSLNLRPIPQTFQTLDFSSPLQPPASPPTSPYKPHIVDLPPILPISLSLRLLNSLRCQASPRPPPHQHFSP